MTKPVLFLLISTSGIADLSGMPTHNRCFPSADNRRKAARIHDFRFAGCASNFGENDSTECKYPKRSLVLKRNSNCTLDSVVWYGLYNAYWNNPIHLCFSGEETVNIQPMIRKGMGLTSILLLVGVTVMAAGFSSSNERADCPGKTTCPLSGEEICKDECPLIDTNRADCPGKVECPLTGELVCRDRCPLSADADATESENELPSCCRDKE